MLLNILSNDLEVSTKSLLIKFMADARIGWVVNNYNQASHSSGMIWITVVVFIWLLLVLAPLWGSQTRASSDSKGTQMQATQQVRLNSQQCSLAYWAHCPATHDCTASVLLLSGFGVLVESICVFLKNPFKPWYSGVIPAKWVLKEENAMFFI